VSGRQLCAGAGLVLSSRATCSHNALLLLQRPLEMCNWEWMCHNFCQRCLIDADSFFDIQQSMCIWYI
jgi:hypothetical protein